MMSLYNFRQYLAYRVKAKSRHGIHSPFVYDLVDKGIRHQKGTLEEKITRYFGKDKIVEIGDGPENWLDEYRTINLTGRIIMVKGIYRTKKHTRNWEVLKNDKGVKLSIDFFESGLLLSGREFKEKQHFILKH